MKKTVKSQQKELDDCRAEITSLKMLIEDTRSRNNMLAEHCETAQSHSRRNSIDMGPLPNEIDTSKASTSLSTGLVESVRTDEGNEGEIELVKETQVNDNETSAVGSLSDVTIADTNMTGKRHSDDATSITDTIPDDLLTLSEVGFVGKGENLCEDIGKPSIQMESHVMKSEKLHAESHYEKMVTLVIYYFFQTS